MTGKDFSLFQSDNGCLVQFITNDVKAAVNALKDVTEGVEMEVTIRPKRKKRSLDANAYLWVLLDKIAQMIRSTKLEVYRELIRDVGVFDYILIPTKAAAGFVKTWNERGDGWIAETEESKIKGTTKIKCYYGSSTYDTKQMSRLIDEAVYQATELGIETMPDEELRKLEEEWGRQ